MTPVSLRRYIDGRVAEQPGIQVRVAQNPYLFNVFFQNEADGLIAGLGGVMLRSEDGGTSWRYVKNRRKTGPVFRASRG